MLFAGNRDIPGGMIMKRMIVFVLVAALFSLSLAACADDRAAHNGGDKATASSRSDDGPDAADTAGANADTSGGDTTVVPSPDDTTASPSPGDTTSPEESDFGKSLYGDVILENNSNIKLVFASGSLIYFFQVNDSYHNDLYCVDQNSGDVWLVDYNINYCDPQAENGYLYYPRSRDTYTSSRFYRVKIANKAIPESVDAVNNGVTVKGSSVIFSNAYVCDGYYYNGNWSDGNTYYYLFRYDANGNVNMICDYIFPATDLNVYNNNLYFDGINLDEDGIYSVSVEGGAYKTLFKGSACIKCVAEDKIFFSTGTNTEGTINLLYIPVNGGNAKKLIDNKIENIIVYDNWAYFIDDNDSHLLKRVNVSTNVVQNLTEGACNHFIIDRSTAILYYISEFSQKTQILRISVGNGISPIDNEPSRPTMDINDLPGNYKIRNYNGADEYCPNFTLHSDNTFSFTVNAFSSMYEMTGTYTFDGRVLTMTPSGSGEIIVLEVNGKDSFLFMNSMLGDTYYGNVFVRQ